MIFTSFNFLIFFPLVVVFFYVCPKQFRWIYLLAVSYFFYINVNAVYALLLAGVTLTTYVCSLLMERCGSEGGKKICLVTDIVLVLLPLFFFKYYNFVNDGIVSFLSVVGLYWPLPTISYLLPIGISFYTFMAIGYIIDVYNEEIEVEKNMGVLGLFVSFFPLILSGPIERAGRMLPQFHHFKPINYGDITSGLKLMLWGYFMKLVIADRLGVYVDMIFNNVAHHNGTTLALASLLYPFQVYGDLGGYSLIAIGVAKCMGIDVMQNFKRPFFATSMSEFWRRWHISLITWLTDYIYTPLSFKYRRWGMTGIVVALMITFLISGIWHGATLTFILWGVIQGIYLSIEAITNKRRTAFEQKYQLNKRWYYIVCCCVATYLLFAFSQIFGRASSASEGFEIVRKIILIHGRPYASLDVIVALAYSFIGLCILFAKDITDEYLPGRYLLYQNKNIVIRFISYAVTGVLIITIGVLDGGQFIYFQF